MIEAAELPKGVMWESCAIMQYLCNKHHLDKFYPTEPEKRAMVDSAMFYIIGTLYPYVVARDLWRSGLPAIRGRGRRERRRRRGEGQGAEGRRRSDRRDARGVPKFYLDGKTFIGGDHLSIADIRLAATLEFLDVIDYDLPAWAKSYMVGSRSKALGAAYAEPAKDVEGYIAYVKGQKK